MKRVAHDSAVAMRDLGLLALDQLLGAFCPAEKTDDVLVIRADALGDFVLWLDAARALKEVYAGRRMVLWCDQSVTELARHVALFDEVVGFVPRRLRTDLRYRAQMIRRLRSRAYDTVLHPVYSRDGDFADGESLVRVARASARIGYAQPPEQTTWRTRISDGWYSRLLSTPPGVRMELRRNADFIRGLGKTDFLADLPALVSTPTSGRDYFVVFPGAGLSHRRWPIERFAEVARRLNQQTGWRGMVCGGGSEIEIAGKLVRDLPSIVESRAGQTSLPELVSLIEGAQFVITNDTSAAHIAAAVATPALAIVGGGEPGRFYPYDPEVPRRRPVPLPVRQPQPCDGCHWHCIHPIAADEPFPCVAAVSVEQVWRSVQKLLAAANDPIKAVAS